jgi:iron complex transport system ATP-binding protein
LLDVRNVRFGYAGRPAFLGPVSLTIQRGQFWAIVGPNGAGKSTLLKLMAGLLRPLEGDIGFRGTPLSRISLRERARHIAFLPQRFPMTLDLSVRDIVLMGRYPHRSMGLFESAQDVQVAENAMVRAGVEELADRPVTSLSGGESQRVHLAAVLAQEPDLLLLDEPTASLDIQHQLAVFEILRALTATPRPAVVVVTHDVNLVAMFCSHVLLLHEGKAVAAGSPDDVLTVERLGKVYEVDLVALSHGEPPRQWLAPKCGARAGMP